MARYTHTDWPRRLFIVRHGQSAGNVARDAAESGGLALIDLHSRDADTPLSALGERQAQALARWFSEINGEDRPTVFLTSPFIRSQQTIRAIATALARGRGGMETVHVDERLREKEFGILDRYTKHGIEMKFPDLAAQRALVGKFYFRPPGGESWCDVILRLRSVVEELRRDYVGERLVVVSHQVVVNCFRYLLERMDESTILAIDRQLDVPNCGVTEYGLTEGEDGKRFRLLRANFVVPLLEGGTPVTREPDRPAGPK
jgi:broad specificity phosphatase PhoE